jgi:hypothetical protein
MCSLNGPLAIAYDLVADRTRSRYCTLFGSLAWNPGRFCGSWILLLPFTNITVPVLLPVWYMYRGTGTFFIFHHICEKLDGEIDEKLSIAILADLVVFVFSGSRILFC